MFSLKFLIRATLWVKSRSRPGLVACDHTSLLGLKAELFHLFNPRRANTGELQNKTPTVQNKSWRSKRKVCEFVLEQFDRQYNEELGAQWTSAREVLLNPNCWQYSVLLNRFSNLTSVQEVFKSLGYHNLLSQRNAFDQPALQCLVHNDAVRLRSQMHRDGWLKQYYLLNAASLLPVLALDVRDGERVLDLCSAPGGKALGILQTANPGLLHCNELDKSRYQWLIKTLESYVPAPVRDMITVTNMDGRDICSSKPGMYDKVLVDAPCSNDRSWLFTGEAQQGKLRLRERAMLPSLQKDLLCLALDAVRPGGLVVYSTCTFSRAENQSVVEAVLASCPDVELLDLKQELICALSSHFIFAHLQPPLGHLVVPEDGRSWGPMYVCTLRRIP